MLQNESILQTQIPATQTPFPLPTPPLPFHPIAISWAEKAIIQDSTNLPDMNAFNFTNLEKYIIS